MPGILLILVLVGLLPAQPVLAEVPVTDRTAIGAGSIERPVVAPWRAAGCAVASTAARRLKFVVDESGGLSGLSGAASLFTAPPPKRISRLITGPVLSFRSLHPLRC